MSSRCSSTKLAKDLEQVVVAAAAAALAVVATCSGVVEAFAKVAAADVALLLEAPVNGVAQVVHHEAFGEAERTGAVER
jgi:DhnA family fructose-bisphosphate aldolase class Ia